MVANACDFTVTLARIDFGRVSSNVAQVRSFTLHSNGTQPADVCDFDSFALAPDSDVEFSLVAAGADATRRRAQAVAGALPLAPCISQFRR